MRRALPLTLAGLSGLLLLVWGVFPPSSAWVDEVYTAGIYETLAGALIPLTGALPFSVVGVLTVGLLALLLAALARSWARRQSVRGFAWTWVRRAGITALVLCALFVVMWGANYGRTPLETRLGLSTAPTRPAEVEALALDLVAIIRRTADDGARERYDLGASLAAGKASLRETVLELEGRTVTLPRHVKTTPPGLLIFTGQATGIVSPWTLEAHVDGALPDPYKLAIALHELTHLAGYGSEAETDFVAGLAGLRARDPYTRYSTALTLFSRVAGALPEGTFRRLYETLPEGAKEDLEALRTVYARYRPPQFAATVQTLFYDTYLRTQGVGAGVADYDRVTDLLVAARRDGLGRLPRNDAPPGRGTLR